MLRPALIFAALALSACSSVGRGGAHESRLTVAAPTLEDGSSTQPLADSYRIGPTDVLNVTVFQIEDLSFEKVRVDVAGMLQMPLIGDVLAAGKTPNELATTIADRLRERYLRNPQVSVTVEQAASQKITVDGAVTKPGVYEMRGRTSLVQAIAMAEGPTRVADLEKVVVFRNVDGRRMAALFDLRLIRSGEIADPYLQGDDIIVVDSSRLSQTMRDIVEALPGLAVFSYL